MVKRRTSFKNKSNGEIDELFDAEMNAMVAKDSEEYYRMYSEIS
jgi:hypothetical protein